VQILAVEIAKSADGQIEIICPAGCDNIACTAQINREHVDIDIIHLQISRAADIHTQFIGFDTFKAKVASIVDINQVKFFNNYGDLYQLRWVDPLPILRLVEYLKRSIAHLCLQTRQEVIIPFDLNRHRRTLCYNDFSRVVHANGVKVLDFARINDHIAGTGFTAAEKSMTIKHKHIHGRIIPSK
jgi:hypothetical protein